MQNRSPLLYIAAAVFLFGGFFLFGGDDPETHMVSAGERGSVSTGARQVSFQEVAGVSDAEMAELTKPGRDPDKEPWLVGPPKAQIIEIVEGVAQVEVGLIKQTAFSAPPLKAGETRDRKIRKMTVDFTKSGSLRLYRVATIIGWTPNGWQLLDVLPVTASAS
ncbi:MAG: hypothetical protein ACFBZ9_18360 [Sphingomonadales bacterium]